MHGPIMARQGSVAFLTTCRHCSRLTAGRPRYGASMHYAGGWQLPVWPRVSVFDFAICLGPGTPRRSDNAGASMGQPSTERSTLPRRIRLCSAWHRWCHRLALGQNRLPVTWGLSVLLAKEIRKPRPSARTMCCVDALFPIGRLIVRSCPPTVAMPRVFFGITRKPVGSDGSARARRHGTEHPRSAWSVSPELRGCRTCSMTVGSIVAC